MVSKLSWYKAGLRAV